MKHLIKSKEVLFLIYGICLIIISSIYISIVGILVGCVVVAIMCESIRE